MGLYVGRSTVFIIPKFWGFLRVRYIFIRTEEQGGGRRGYVCRGLGIGRDVRCISAGQSGQGTGFHDGQDAGVKIDENFLDR
jgi:hypothetical protein